MHAVSARAQKSGCEFLDGSLARRASDADNFRLERTAIQSSDLAESKARIVNADKPRFIYSVRAWPIGSHKRASGPGCKCFRHEIVTVCVFTGSADEESAELTKTNPVINIITATATDANATARFLLLARLHAIVFTH